MFSVLIGTYDLNSSLNQVTNSWIEDIRGVVVTVEDNLLCRRGRTGSRALVGALNLVVLVSTFWSAWAKGSDDIIGQE